jgi:hypothetical protein
VLCHHHRSPGPLAKKSEAQQMARLVQRADIFGARLAPRVAVVMNRDGMPTGEMIPRDTSQAAWKIAGVVAYRDVREELPLDRLLALV